MMELKSLIFVGTVLLIWLSLTTASSDISCYQSAWDSPSARRVSDRLAYISNGSCATVESRHFSGTGYWNLGWQTITLDPDVEMITIVFDARTNMSRRRLSLDNSRYDEVSSFSNGPYDSIVTIPGNSFQFYFSESRPSSETFGMKFYALGGNSEAYDQGGFYKECSIRTPFEWIIENSPTVSVKSAGENLEFKVEFELPWCRPDDIDLEFDLSRFNDSEKARFNSRSSVSILSEPIFEWEKNNGRLLADAGREDVSEESGREATNGDFDECVIEMAEESESEETSKESGMEEIEVEPEEVTREEKKDEENREEINEESRVEDDPPRRRAKLALIHDFPRQSDDFWRFCYNNGTLHCYFTINAKMAGQVVKFWRIKININNESVGSVGAEVDIFEGEEVEENEEVALGFKLIGGFDPRLPPSESYKINDDAFVQIDGPTELEIHDMKIRSIQIRNSGSEMDITSASEVRRMSNILHIARVPLLLSGRVTITITARWHVYYGRRILETNSGSSTNPDTDGENQERIYTLELDVDDGQESTDPGTVIITTSEEESDSFPSVIMIVAVSTIIIAAIVLFFCYKLKRAKLDAASANAASSDTQRYLATKVKEPQTDTEQEEFVRV